MAAPSPKQRAVTMKRNGMDDSLVGAILGISSDDVRSLVYEADPDVQIGGGAGGALALVTIPIDTSGLNLHSSPTSWEELLIITAPTDASAYLLQGTAFIASRNGDAARAGIYATDPESFHAYYIDGTIDAVPMLEPYIKNDGPDWVELRSAVSLEVAPGQDVGLTGMARTDAIAGLGLWWVELG